MLPGIRRTLVTTVAATFAALAVGSGIAAAAPADGPLFSCRSVGDPCRPPGDAPVTVPAAPTTPVPVPVPVSTVPVVAAEPNGTMTTAEFIAAAVPGAQRSRREHGVPASVTLAQAILESGWGKSALSTFDRNFFGMKCNGQGLYANGCRTHDTSECTAAGQCFPTQASFRTYATAADSFRDHGATLASLARYSIAFQYTNDPNRFAAEIHRAGYATDPQYTVKLTNVMAKYNLYQYDV
ncbi:sporangiospore maturation cell wall hydrolase GsmA [Dactylosporangium vinaceum]|uniref:Sporangiospore maturation cell wall hydrolase GsmA n=1 Tax=Dactylosporangium vinaceum TaxID=53362 RepID=A0ABV5MEM7_9ACTN|nr:sporangiospore maturation cell wall hydrolase GsmA [Dactylosporangium vinaceum]UAB92526.1 sporangiospore maturation cell wall hydrolase GsmA [Dactylosporangium vinaceum]